MMGRQLRSPLTMSFESGSPLRYCQRPDSKSEPAAFISQAGQNTAIIMRNKWLIDTSTLVDNGDRSHNPVNNEKFDHINNEKLDTSKLLLSEEECTQN